jgi:hypothetical protein
MADRIFVCPDSFVERDSPPTSYAIAAFLNGEPDGATRVVKGMLQRSIFIAPGAWLSGTKGLRNIARTSLIVSASISTILLGFYMMERQGIIEFERENGRKIPPPTRFPAAG